MPTIPSPEQLGEAQKFNPATGLATYEPPNWRTLGLAGQLVEKTGSEVQQAGDVLQQMNARQDDYVAQDAANKLKAAATGLMVDPETGFANKKGAEVVGPAFRDGYMQQYQQKQQEIADTLQTDQQRKTFALHSQAIGNEFQANLLTHQARATTDFNNEVNTTAIGVATRDAIGHPWEDENGNNTTRDTAFMQIENAYHNMAHDQGLTGADGVQWVANKMAAVKQVIMNQSIQSVLDANEPVQAQKMYATAIQRGDLLPGDPIGAKVQAHANQAQSDQFATNFAAQFVASKTHDGGPTADNMWGSAKPGPNDVTPYHGSDVATVASFVASPSKYDGFFKSAGDKFNVDPTLLKLLIGMENHGHPNETAVNTSSGARGLAQIMPANEAAFGITNWKDPEQAINGAAQLLAQSGLTVGTDYTQAAKVYYGSPNQAKWGPNTQQYAENVRAVTAMLHGGVKPSQGPTTAEDLEGMTGELRAAAEREVQNPRYGHSLDPAWQKTTVDGVMQQHAQAIQALKGQQQADTQNVFSAFTNPDPTQQPKSLADFTTAQRHSYDALPPQVQHEFLGMLQRSSKEDVPENEANTKETFRLMGLANNDQVAFKNQDIAHIINNGTFTNEQRRLLGNTYMSIDKKTAVGASVDKWLREPSVQGWMRSSGLLPQTGGDKPNTPHMQDNYNIFTGRFKKSLDDYVAAKQKLPEDGDALDMARKLTADYAIPTSHWYGNSDTPVKGYQVDDQKTPPRVPVADAARLTPEFIRVYGQKPTDAQLGMVYAADTLHPNDRAFRDSVHDSITKEIQQQKTPPAALPPSDRPKSSSLSAVAANPNAHVIPD